MTSKKKVQQITLPYLIDVWYDGFSSELYIIKGGNKMLPIILFLAFAVIYIIGEAMNGWQKGMNYQNLREIRRMQEEQEMREQYRLNMMRQELEQQHIKNNKGDEPND